jgi:RNA processing factor Prp31
MDGDSKIYVLLFTQRIDSGARAKIRKYIQQNLQRKMDAELKGLPAPPPKPKPESKTEPETESKPEPGPKSEPKTESKPKTGPKP